MKEAIYSWSDSMGENLKSILVAGIAGEAFTEIFGALKVRTAFSFPLLSLPPIPHVSCSYGSEQLHSEATL